MVALLSVRLSVKMLAGSRKRHITVENVKTEVPIYRAQAPFTGRATEKLALH